MAKSTVNSTTSEVETEDGSSRKITQYKTTVPKAVAEAMSLDGAKIEWEVASADSLRVSVVAREDDE